MTGTINGSSETGVSGQGRRARQPVPRTRRVEFTLTGEEYAAVVAAAGRAGLARGAYAAQTARPPPRTAGRSTRSRSGRR